MPVVAKSLTVYFYVVEPMPTFGNELRSFNSGAYPIDDVLETIRRLDPAADDYRIQENLFGGETFCVVHDDGPQPVLGAYYRDNLARPLTEFKGEINELVLREGEALVDAAYASFFPGDVVGLVRTSSKAPGFAKIGQWLSVKGGYSCGLIALRDPQTLAQLDREPTKMHRLLVRIRRNRIVAVEPYSSDVASALRAAAEINRASDEVGVDLRVKNAKERANWSRIMRQEIEELLAVLPDFEQAVVYVSGQKRPLNLLRTTIQRPVPVLLYDTKRVGATEAAEALFEAYEKERNSIELAVRAFRGGPSGDAPPS